MSKYRKKPVVIEAFQLGKDPMPEWVMDAVTSETVTLHMDRIGPQRGAVIKTLEGDHFARAWSTDADGMTICLGDFVIQGVKGELYPCKPDIFEATYEPVENTDGPL